jgi:hypothetical protein
MFSLPRTRPYPPADYPLERLDPLGLSVYCYRPGSGIRFSPYARYGELAASTWSTANRAWTLITRSSPPAVLAEFNIYQVL